MNKCMKKYTLGIEGMRCGMCELHVEEAITKSIKVKKARASRFKNNLVAITELVLQEEDFKKLLEPTGYQITSFERSVAVKKLFGWR